MIGLGVAVAVVAAVGFFFMRGHSRRASQTAAVVDAMTPLPEIANRLAKGETRALAAVYQRVMARQEGIARGLSESEGDEWVEVLKAMRAGYPHFGAFARASALMVTGRVVEKFGIEPAPSRWVEILPTSHDLFSAALASDEPENVRIAAMGEISRLWIWFPGRSLTPIEETALTEWKEAFHGPVVQQLAASQPVVRAAAVVCLSELPIDDASAPAIAYLNDPDPDVRRQVIAAFADRPSVLTNEMILRHLGDSDHRIPAMVEQVLKGRGLNEDQIGLGGMIVHAKPEVRESVIPLVKDRTDIDPVTWLVYLSRDKVESVRMKAIEALSARNTPEAQQRLAEMAINDPSPAVKKLACRFIAPAEETASLPPLPGSPSLTPKAN
jgi:hypothetical protein